MERFKGTWVVVAIFAVLLAFLLLRNPKTREEAREDELTLVKADREKLERVEIAHGTTGASIVLEKKDEEWRMTAPRDLPVDDATVNLVKNGLEELVAIDSVWPEPTAEDRKKAGLDTPAAAIKWKAGDASGTVELGNELPPKRTSRYVTASGKPGIWTASKGDLEVFFRGVPEMRRKRLLAFDRDKIRSILIERPGREPGSSASEGGGPGAKPLEIMMLSRSDAVAPWIVSTPFTGRADRGKANGLLTRLTNLSAEAFVDTPSVQHGVEGHRGTVTLSGDGGRSWTVLVGAEKKAGGKALVEVREGEEGQTILAESALAQDVLDPYASWRDKQLFDFFVDDVTRVALPAEATPLAFTRDAGRMFTTTGGSAVMVNDEATALLRSARDATVTEFGKDAPPGSKAAQELGLEKPFVVVQWTAQETPFELVIGGAKPGGALRWVRTHESPTAVLVDADPIVRAAAALAAAAKPKPAGTATPTASATAPPSPAASPTN